jgi:GH43 family beta-xylosidase
MTLIVAFAASVLVGAASDSVAQVTPTPLSSAAAGDTFTNPLLPTGPDPWVVWWKGFYYYSNSSGTNLTLRKTADITDLRHAEKKAVWTPEPGRQWSNACYFPLHILAEQLGDLGRFGAAAHAAQKLLCEAIC